MICHHCINRGFPCQKGFLLLEALVALTALAILMTVVASWYTHAVIAQKRVIERLEATNVGVSYIGNVQAQHVVPSSGITEQDGYTIQTVVTPDADEQHIFWVQVQVSKGYETAGADPVVAELISTVVV